MKVTILGNNSALPAYGRHPTAQVVSVNGRDILLDCGEGMQIQMQKYGLRWRNMDHIFISHLHGDHYFGLPGFINSMNLLGRTEALHLHAPAPLEGILKSIFEVADTRLGFPFFFHPLPAAAELLVDTLHFKVSCFPVIHRIDCFGFLVESKNKGRRLLPEECRRYEIPAAFYNRLKKGEDYLRKDGELIKNEWVTAPGPAVIRYAYCADTLYTESFLPYIKDIDAMYHESTYLDLDREKAAARYHTSAVQAARLALKANVGKLLLGHFSSKYQDLEPFREEAAAIFSAVEITREGETYHIG